jgi:fatty-acyl-CoA synthase
VGRAAAVARAGELTLERWLRDRATVTPARMAIEQGERRLTYEELNARSERLGAALLAAGLARGARVASLSANRIEHVELLFACAKAGLVLAPLSIRLAPAELAFALNDCEPALLAVEPEQQELAAAACALLDSEPPRLALSAGALDAFSAGFVRCEAAVADGDGLLLLYTSGTTGHPKGALLTHANCFWTNLSLDRICDLTGADVVLQVLPQFHVGGWNVRPLLAWWKGATVVLERTFDAGRALELIAGRGITTMMGVPANYLFMSQHERFAQADLSTLRQAIVGGAPMPEALLETWQRRGVTIMQGYGLTEAAPNVLCLPPEDAVRKRGFAGWPYPHVEVALRSLQSGVLVEGPGTGELLVRGPNVFAGYWRNEAATAAALRDGWLHTGDVAERDEEGCYRICDRLKDMFISGGENVYPAEVEAVLHGHQAVADAAVIGVPDERWGEVGLALVVARRPVSEQELLVHCRARLARFKVPRAVRFVRELPRSPSGKLIKRELREPAIGGDGRARRGEREASALPRCARRAR